MKKILLYTLMTVAAAGMTACEDFLTRDTYDQIGSDEFWKSETDLELYANGFIQKMIPGDGTITRGDIDADYYIMVDGDDTYPAEAARDLIAPLAAGEADMTVGDRLSNGSYGEENDRAFHGFGNNLVRWLIKAIYGFAFDDVMTGYRAFNRAFVKTMPVLSEGFQIETELSIHAVDKRWRIIDVPIEYRDRPEGSYSKLSTFGDGAKVLKAIASLFKEYKPLAFFGWISLILVALGLIVGIPVITAFVATGVVLRIPSTVLAVGLVFCGCLSMTAGLILDSVAKANRKQWELEVYKFMSKDNE